MSEKTPPETTSSPGRFAYDGLDRVLHEKARLGILVSLSPCPDGLAFAELKELCALTDGNLSRHLDALARAGLVEIHKGFAGRRPHTRILLTSEGRRRFLAYLAELERVIRDAHSAQTQPAARPELAGN